MKIDIRAGKRVLYKDGNSGWLVGIIDHKNAEINEQGIWLPIIPKEFMNMDAEDVPYIQYAEINNIFLEAEPVDDYIKDYSDIFMTKEEYIKIIEEDETFVKAIEQAYVSDGEYYYYPITKFNKTWIEKQPFEYVVRFK